MADSRLLSPKDVRKHFPVVIQGNGLPDGKSLEKFEQSVNNTPNAALLWQRYMPSHENEGITPARPSNSWGLSFSEEAKALDEKHLKAIVNTWDGLGAITWYCKVVRAFQAASADLITNVRERRQRACRADGVTRFLTISVDWRALVGIGNPATFENSGFAFHHTYGFPILPGSSLKGLVRHYLEEEYLPEAADPGDDARPVEVVEVERHIPGKDLVGPLFGSPEGEGNEGAVVFHDGWPLPKGPDWFEPDVLTVHHPKYYRGAESVADDTDGPNPVHFLALRKGVRFEVPLALSAYGRCLLNAEQQAAALKFTSHLLTLALKKWGAGARTGAGYGRMQTLNVE